MKFGRQRAKRLGGEPPRGRMRWTRKRGLPESTPSYSSLVVLAVGLFVVGGVVGFAWALDREIRGGILQQRAQAEDRPDWVHLESLPAYVPAAILSVVEPDLARGARLRTPEDPTYVSRELVRQVHLLPSSLSGEAQELVMGPVLERRLSRDALVELYLNRAYLGKAQGQPVYGIFHASQEFFGKPPTQLTLGEAATLAALLLPPRIEDPELRAGAVGSRRNEVLRVMLLGGLITRADYQEAITEPLGFQPGLEQIPMSRPVDWGARTAPIRLPPNLRPSPSDSTAEAAPAP